MAEQTITFRQPDGVSRGDPFLQSSVADPFPSRPVTVNGVTCYLAPPTKPRPADKRPRQSECDL